MLYCQDPYFVPFFSDHLNHQDHVLETQMKELKRLIIAASQTSAKSDASLAKALSLSVAQHDSGELERDRESESKKIVMEPNQLLTGIGIVMCLGLIFGSFLGRIS